jgi:hypothetical protein
MANGAYSYPGAPSYRETGIPVAVRRISWGSIFAGVAVALVLQLLFALLGLSIGLAQVNPTQGEIPAAGLGIGAGIWWTLTSLISLFFGGWAAGRLAGVPRKFDGALHGILSWSLATFLTIFFLGSALGSIIGGGFSMVRSGLSGATQAASALKPESGGEQQAATGAMSDAKQKAQEKLGPKADEMKDKAQETMQKFKNPETGEKAASGVATASLITFAALLLGGISSGLGGATGSPKDAIVPARETADRRESDRREKE